MKQILLSGGFLLYSFLWMGLLQGEPGSAAATVVMLINTCPPAAAAVAIGEIVALGATSLAMYCAHKKLEKNKKNDGCFSHDDASNQSQNTGCYPEYIRTIPSTPGCTITVEKPRSAEIIPYEKPEGMNDACAFPAVVPQNSIVHAHDTNKDDCGEKKQYNGPWYNRTEDWINEHPFGQKIKKSLERSPLMNQGKRVFEVVKKIEDCDGFNKGDYVVVDAMHKDHLEVFSKNKKWNHVANFDGTKNEKKTEQGRKEARQPLQ